MDIKPTVENYALHLKNTCTDKEIHDLVGSIYADEEVMEAAIEIVYFAPREIKSLVH